MDYKYDVFISYSRRDYVDDNKQIIEGNPVSAIKKVFDDNNITYWFDEEGIYSGQAFVEVITDAISESKCFVFVSSHWSNESKWTRSEILEAFDANKTIIPFKIENVDYHRSLKFYLRQYDFITFYDNHSDALAELVRSVNKVKADIEEQERKAFLEREKENIKQEIETKSKDYLLQREQLSVIEKSIWEKESELGISQKECPVCGRSTDIMSSFCEACGWSFHFLSGISKEYDLTESKGLTKLRANWKLIDAYLESKKQVTTLNALLQSKNEEIGQLEKDKNLYPEKLNSLQKDLAANKEETERLQKELKTKEDLLQSKDDEIQSISRRLDDEMKQSSDIKHNLESQLQKSQSEYAALKRQYDEDKKYIEEVKKKEKEEEAKRLAKEEEKRKGFRLFTVNGVTFKMIRVEGGTFQMGATSEQGRDARNEEKPIHTVTLSDFMIGETEVTQELWEAVMDDNPSCFKETKNPVERVSWKLCKEFIKKLNILTDQKFRLPTEAEWEFAARGGNKSQHFKYSGSNEIDKVAWYEGNSGNKPHPVGSKKANELGLYDMSGNVWEWCEDWYGVYTYASQTNPKGSVQGSNRVGRGGSWSNSASGCRVSLRVGRSPGSRSETLGFRLAL